MFFRTPKTCTLRLAPRGLTLVEMLIGMAITLVMMAAVVTLFANIGAGVRVQRASMELGSQLRLARARLFKDLAGATCAARPKLPSDDHDDGYLELVEGQYSDKNPSALIDGMSGNGELDYATSIVPSSNLNLTAGDITDGGGLGDYDDILALTVRSESEPFVGPGRRLNNTTNLWEDATIESDLAEVVWFAVENPTGDPAVEPGLRTIYRRVLLIAPWIDVSSVPVSGANNAQRLKNFYDQYDISVRLEQPTAGTFIWVPNTLADLTKREHRFGHYYSFTAPPAPPQKIGFPYIFPYDPAVASPSLPMVAGPGSSVVPLDGARQGEDVMLNDVLAFDLRVFDPGAPLRRTPQPPATGPDVPFSTLEPSDLGWDLALGVKIGFGSYVDLGWGRSPVYAWAANEPAASFYLSHQAGWHPRLPATSPLNDYPCVYDTWSYHYESDGIDQDTDGIDDEGTDGLDTNNADGVDDSFERETAPPYDVPLRGMQVKLRVYDRDSRQIREATVTRNFVPQ